MLLLFTKVWAFSLGIATCFTGSSSFIWGLQEHGPSCNHKTHGSAHSCLNCTASGISTFQLQSHSRARQIGLSRASCGVFHEHHRRCAPARGAVRLRKVGGHRIRRDLKSLDGNASGPKARACHAYLPFSPSPGMIPSITLFTDSLIMPPSSGSMCNKAVL